MAAQTKPSFKQRRSEAEIQNTLEKVLADNDFRKQFLDAVNKLFREDKNFKNQLLSSLDARSKSRLSNLKAGVLIQIILTGILIAVFLAYVYLTFAQINTRPMGIPMEDGHMEMFDPYSRAKDLLILIIPMFTTVISFWLGFSIQEKKVNQAKEDANNEREMHQNADEMRQKMEMKMAKVEQVTTIMPENEVSKHIHKIMENESI
jgi:hypothetical protein